MPKQRKSRPAGKTAGARWTSSRKSNARDGRRPKISTTIAPENHAFLERLVADGKAGNLAEAIDLVLEEAQRIDNRERLERMTAEGYESMSPEAIAETGELEEALTRSVGDINL